MKNKVSWYTLSERMEVKTEEKLNRIVKALRKQERDFTIGFNLNMNLEKVYIIHYITTKGA